MRPLEDRTRPAVNHDEPWPALLAARYGTVSAPDASDLPLGEALRVMLTHRSVRAYADRPLPPVTLEALVAAAQSAPTSSNLQAWSVIAVEDEARRQRLSALVGHQRHVAQAPLFLVFLADLARLDAVALQQGKSAHGLDYLESFVLAVADAAFAAQNAVVALESLGLGACYIGAIRNKPEAVAAELRLPPKAVALFGLTVGYPDPAVRTGVKPRLAASVVLHREHYAAPAADDVAAYDERLQAFQADQGMTRQPWSVQASNRVRGPEALSGRDRLREALDALGFDLR